MATLRGSVVFAALAILATARSAGAGTSSNSDGPNNGGSNGEGGSSGPGFGVGGNGEGAGVVSSCTDPTCVGATPQGNCDTGLAIDSANAMDGAKAIGLCKEYTEGTWGVKSASWVRSDGQPLTGLLLDGKGILDKFGPIMPREGGAMLAISSGAAREPGDAGFQDPGGYMKSNFEPHGAPPGYPKESPSCPGVTTGSPYDSAGLRLVIQTPTDAKSFSYEFDFYTYEFPGFICSTFNDFFVAMLNPKISTLPDGNISFDSQGNSVSVNAGFLQVCTAQTAGGKVFPCDLGPTELGGTGFEDHAATSWLQTKAPIEAPGTEITLDFLIWDSGDEVLDSTTVIDHFLFAADGATTGTTPVPE